MKSDGEDVSQRLPIDWPTIRENASAEANYLIRPNDRLLVIEDAKVVLQWLQELSIGDDGR